MPRFPSLLTLLFVLGWTSACINVPDVVDPPQAPSDAGSNLPPNAGGNRDAGPVDSLGPTLLNTEPMGGATKVPRSARLILTFSEPMDVGSVEVNLQPPVTLGAPLWSQQNRVLTLQPTAELAENADYSVSVDGKDVAGNSLTGKRSFSFTTTGPAPDTTPPTVLVVSPRQTSTGNARNTLFEVVFSEPMNKASVQAAFSLTAPSGFNNGTFSWNEAATVMTYEPPAAFSYGADVTWQVSTSARDAAGNAMAETMISSFRVIRQGTLTVNFDPDTSGSVGAPGYLRQSNLYNFVNLGDGYGNETFRLFLGFKLARLPEDLTRITQATLSWWVTAKVGTPFEKFGELLLEPVNVGNQLETALLEDSPNPALIADYHTGPLAAGTPVLPSAIGAPGMFDVTSSVVRDWSDRAARDRRTQYRLRFAQASDQNGQRDALISDSETHPKLAELYVVYEYP